MATNPGDIKNRRQTTCKVWLKRTGDTTFTDLGDVGKYSQPDERQYADIKQARKGFRQTTGKLLGSVGLMWKFTLNEQLMEVQRLLGLATKGADTTQASATGQSETFNAVVLGATYFLAKLDVTSVVVTVSAVTKTLGVDYDIEPGSSALTILKGGSIAAGANVVVAYNCNAVTLENYTALKDLRVTGTLKVAEYDSFGEAPRLLSTFACQLWVSSPGENTGEAPTEVEITALVTDANPLVQKRAD